MRRAIALLIAGAVAWAIGLAAMQAEDPMPAATLIGTLGVVACVVALGWIVVQLLRTPR